MAPRRIKRLLCLYQFSSEIPVPSFDREEGLRRAIEMAVNGTFKVASWLTHPWDHPLNSYMRDAITQMIDRSHRVRMFQE